MFMLLFGDGGYSIAGIRTPSHFLALQGGVHGLEMEREVRLVTVSMPP